MQRVLITGAAGFIGHHLAIAWRRRGAAVVIVDNLRTGKRDNLEEIYRAVGHEHVTYVAASVVDREAVMRAAEGCSVVHHLAAMVSVPESVEHPEECIAINVQGTLNVLEAARRHGASRVVFASSSAVYGDDPRSPKTEDMLPAPLTPYGITKLDGEYYARMYASLHGVPTVSLRFFNVFGPRQDPKSVYAAAVPIFIDRAVKGLPITVYGDGTATRDFVYVDDVCQANLLAATSPAVGKGEVFNVAQGGVITIQDLAEAVRHTVNSVSDIVNAAERPGDIKHSRASIARITEMLGFKPAVSLEEGLQRAVAAVAAVAQA